MCIRDSLTNDGVMVINVGRMDTDRRLIDGLTGTIRQVFPSVHVVDLPDAYNTLLFATVQPSNTSNLMDNYSWLQLQKDIHPLLLETMQSALSNIQPTPQLNIVYTDDVAPIELITNEMILSYLFTPLLGTRP